MTVATIEAGVRRGRVLGTVTALTVDDWRQIHDAYLSFLYQVRLIVDRAEGRNSQ